MSSQPPTKPESVDTKKRAEAAYARAREEQKRKKREELKQQIQDTLPPHLAALAFEDLNADRKSDNIYTGIALLLIACALALLGAYIVSQTSNKKVPEITVGGVAAPKKTKKVKTQPSPTFAVALNPVNDPNLNKVTLQQIKQSNLKRLFDSLDYTKPASVAATLELLSEDEALNVLKQIPGWRLPAIYERLSSAKLAALLKVMLAMPEWQTLMYNIPAEALKEARTVGTANGTLNGQQQKIIDNALASGQLPTDKGYPPGYRSPTNPQTLPDNNATPINLGSTANGTAADQRYATTGTNLANNNTAADQRYTPATDKYALP